MYINIISTEHLQLILMPDMKCKLKSDIGGTIGLYEVKFTFLPTDNTNGKHYVHVCMYVLLHFNLCKSKVKTDI